MIGLKLPLKAKEKFFEFSGKPYPNSVFSYKGINIDMLFNTTIAINSTNLFGGVGLDGNGDVLANGNDPEDVLYTFAAFLSEYGLTKKISKSAYGIITNGHRLLKLLWDMQRYTKRSFLIWWSLFSRNGVTPVLRFEGWLGESPQAEGKALLLLWSFFSAS
ncbi:hypothetical protein [Tuberibacillus sp. Marseille-P3662]|uniref:hypothetical protein n=1 Tax=Tuberibacillus sp. Marseille-P3662 TaxID=1965358 RepID=UPI000A1CAE05|nr:hypothetical protein [Tuberibacillus sp. Marseille-P3662]